MPSWIILFGLLLTKPIWAGEFPMQAPAPPPAPPLLHKSPNRAHATLAVLFQAARGLKDYEAGTIHIQRISCDRRMFAPSGRSIEGDGDLKVTHIVDNLFETEFPTQIYFKARNPYGTDAQMIETVRERRLLNFQKWKDGQTLVINKEVFLRYASEHKASEFAWATDELRIISDTSPPTYLVRETVWTAKPLRLYMICR